MPDINSFLDTINDNIKQIRRDISALQMLERPAETSGIAASRPTTGRVGQRYFSTDTGAYEYWNGSGWAAVAGGGGGVTAVTGTSPVVSSGGTTPAISLINSGVTGGSYTNPNITVSVKGIITAISSGSGGGVTTASLPLAITGSNIALSATAANDGGTIVKSPSFTQTGFIQISGSLTSGSVSTGAVSASSVTSTGPIKYGTVTVIERGGTFPTTGLVDGYRYYHTTYRSWFTYNSTDALWRQEAPGVFGSSFPTVNALDDAVAPKIEVKRLDRNITYFWDSTSSNWLGTILNERPLGGKNASNVMTAPGAGNFLVTTAPLKSDYDWWVEGISIVFIHFVAQSGTNFYAITSSMSLSGTVDTKADTVVGTTYRIEPTLTPAVWAATHASFEINLQQNGSPGNIEFNPLVRYRFVG